MDTRSARAGTRRQGYGSRVISMPVVAPGLFIADHRVHVAHFLPSLLLALCPLMHLFGRRGDSRGYHRHRCARETTCNAEHGER